MPKEIRLGFWQGILLLPILIVVAYIVLVFIAIIVPVIFIVGALTGNLKITVNDNEKKNIQRKRHREGRDIY